MLSVYSTVYAQQPVPNLTGRVVDQAGILSEQTEQQITDLIASHEDSTSNQIAVLTVSSLGGDNLEDFSLRVARTWELGQADKNNGVLVLVAVAERRIRIEVGYGLEGDLPDITANRIINGEMTPYFREGDFDNGVLFGVRSIRDAIEGTYESSSAALYKETFGKRLLAALLMMVVPVFVIAISILRSRVAFWVTTAFVLPFVFMAGFTLFLPYGGLISTGGFLVFLYVIRTLLRKSTKWAAIMTSIVQAKPGESVAINIGGVSWTYRIPKSSSGGSSSGGYSGGGGFRSSSGFSGGGGSFGGGGASGSW